MKAKIEKSKQPNNTITNIHSPMARKQMKNKEEILIQLSAARTAVSSQGDTLYISESGRNILRESQNEADGKVIQKNSEQEKV